MFGDTLLESSSVSRKGKRWPMATAFTMEIIVAGVLVIIPLLSTGVIPLSAAAASPPIILHPMPVEPIEHVRLTAHGPACPPPRSMAVVLVSANPNAIHWGPAALTTTDPREATPPGYFGGPGTLPGNFIGPENGSNVTVDRPTRITSRLSEAQLVHRVEPVYPRIATLSGIQGEVKLHAIIARDGSIQSLNAISGHPVLVRAALDAVEQWRYRPYVLNGVTVEVETLITVIFRKDAR